MDQGQLDGLDDEFEDGSDDGSSADRRKPDPLRGKWYPLLPRCPHCGTTQVPRSAHVAGLCKRCNASRVLSARYEASPLPSALGTRSWVLFCTAPERWLRYLCGASHLQHVPSAAHAHEAHRVMHIMCARHHGDEEVELTWDAVSELASAQRDPWSHVAPGASMLQLDSFQDEAESEERLAARERHNRHVRIWRTKFNTQVVRPLTRWLSKLGLHVGGGIERTTASRCSPEQPNAWSVDLVLDCLAVPQRLTEWALVFSREDVSIVCRGLGNRLPDSLAIMDGEHEPTLLPFSHALLATCLDGWMPLTISMEA